MKTSVIKRNSGKKVAVLREDYLEICEGNIAASLLLAFFEYWHNIKIEMVRKNRKLNDTAELYGDGRCNDETLLQFHTKVEIHESMMGLVGMKSITTGRDLLVRLGFISLHKNPNRRYHFDKTQFFLVHPDKVNLSLSKVQNNTTVMSKRHDGDVNLTPAIPITTSVTSSIKERPPIVPQDDLEGFEVFWKAYPCGKSKENARKAWRKLKPNADLQERILSAVEQHKMCDEWQRDGGKYVPHASTWLNGKRWEDELDGGGCGGNPEMMMD